MSLGSKIFSVMLFQSLLFLNSAQGHYGKSHSFESHYLPVFASLRDLNTLKVPILARDEVSEVGFAYLDGRSQSRLQELSHSQGKCGGFEVLPENSDFNFYVKQLDELKSTTLQYQLLQKMPWQPLRIQSARQEVIDAVSLVQETNLQETVTWLSSFKNRSERDPEGSAHIYQMKKKLEEMLSTRKAPWSVDIISHTRTSQKSLRVRLAGQTRPQEIIVLGGHHDSISSSWSGGGARAPGADDNASGSANLLEILRILAEQKQLERTVEIMWYAAEESGLLGSAEIAKAYKDEKKDVVAVLQLDMTLFPGTGEMTITNITDFTHPWLQDFMKQVNETYIGLKILDDKCGYGCSDHASWHRQGFPAVLPFESMSNQMNPNIHTPRDVISPELSFKHSAAIAKLALAFAMELASSNLRPPIVSSRVTF